MSTTPHSVAERHTVHLRDYVAPPWRVLDVSLEFDLDAEHSEVTARLTLQQDPAQPDAVLFLHGEELELLTLSIDGRALTPADYRLDGNGLTVPWARGTVVLQSRVRIAPSRNTAMQGLYLSGSHENGFLLTQCEAEGFRRITYFVDRPDVLARYEVLLRADALRYPVLLANGNPAGTGSLDDGRHWARWIDPHPKPSYLFALVAGRLDYIQSLYTTSEGRNVTLRIYAEGDAIAACGHAMRSLERAMRWDEQRFARAYDLDVFNIVATHDFTMGAMENKGLNIFNAKFLLANTATSTDADFAHVQAVVAHEYFHNWTGNRVTCRDWFQLSLKEGLTVYREQEFCADQGSAALQRIEDVQTLWRAQFAEDAGPLAHPVRPESYLEINNFYTATVYEKGAEIVRMLAVALGRDGFRRGMDLYFDRHDGSAATIEDFLAALGDANARDLTPYLAWYRHAGTPRLQAHGEYDAQRRTYRLDLEQLVPALAHADAAPPLPIPVALSLYLADGRAAPLYREGADAPDGATAGALEHVLVLSERRQSVVFTEVESAPVPSLLRGYSAPVLAQFDLDPAALALLLRADTDGCNRWLAAQTLMTRGFDGGDDADAALTALSGSLAVAFADAALDPALLAQLLILPAEINLAERLAEIDPDQVLTRIQRIEVRLGADLAGQLLARYRALQPRRDDTVVAIDARAQAQRRLKNRCLELICRIDPARGVALAQAQFDAARGMTDSLAALTCLVREGGVAAGAALARFFDRHADNALALDKWFALQAGAPQAQTLAQVQALTVHPAFRWNNPNRVYALLLTFGRNLSAFHRADGAGYGFFADAIERLDALNPQVAARLATCFNAWRRYEPQRRELQQLALRRLLDGATISADLRDIVQRAL